MEVCVGDIWGAPGGGVGARRVRFRNDSGTDTEADRNATDRAVHARAGEARGRAGERSGAHAGRCARGHGRHVGGRVAGARVAEAGMAVTRTHAHFSETERTGLSLRAREGRKGARRGAHSSGLGVWVRQTYLSRRE
jgi:hypothetical protein